MTLEVKILDGEYWWGVSSAESKHQPFDKSSEYFYDMYKGYNQTMPLLLSNLGRYIWCDKPMMVRFSGGVIYLDAKTEIFFQNRQSERTVEVATHTVFLYIRFYFQKRHFHGIAETFVRF
jgi:hypothetical protein